jgi:hypothetical protein
MLPVWTRKEESPLGAGICINGIGYIGVRRFEQMGRV